MIHFFPLGTNLVPKFQGIEAFFIVSLGLTNSYEYLSSSFVLILFRYKREESYVRMDLGFKTALALILKPP